jgi:hypothetical protein
MTTRRASAPAVDDSHEQRTAAARPERRRPPLLWAWRDRPKRSGTGSQQRAALVIDALAEWFTVHLILIHEGHGFGDEPDAEPMLRCSSSVEVAQSEAAAAIGRLRDEENAVAVVLFGFTTAVALATALRHLGPLYIDLDELLSCRQQRFAATPGLPREQRDEFLRSARLFQMLERQLLPLFQGFFVASAVEQRNLRGLVPPERVTVVPNATRHRSPLPPANSEAPHTLLFVGKMDYFPNLDAMAFFLGDVWPLLRSRYGDRVRFHLVGAHAPDAFRPDAWPGVIHSRHCCDVLPAYAEASLAVVPIRSGGGTRVKILEAFALGRPVVSTTLGAEGLEIEPGRHLLTADTPETMAEACAELLDEPDRAAAIAAEAAAFARARHSPEAISQAVGESDLVRDRARLRPAADPTPRL